MLVCITSPSASFFVTNNMVEIYVTTLVAKHIMAIENPRSFKKIFVSPWLLLFEGLAIEVL